MVFLDLKLTNFRFCFNYIHIATSISKLSFRVTKSARDWETAWKHSDWTDDVFRLSWLWGSAARLFLLFRVSFNALGCRCLVDLSSSLDDPLILLNIRWLVIPTKRHDNLPTVDGDDRPAITYVSTVACLSNYQNHDGARAWSIDYYRISIFISALAHLQESFLCRFEALDDCILGVLRKSVLLNYEVMELIP